MKVVQEFSRVVGHNMKLNEIKVIDYAEKAYFELYSTLKKYKLLENNNDNKIFSEFIDGEKSRCILNPNTTDDYYPLYLHSSPVANFITGRYISNPANFIKKESERSVFNTKHGIIKFPLNKNLGDGRIDLMIFDKLDHQQHFLSILGLKFAGWSINITQADL
jgi:hypothetical protein